MSRGCRPISDCPDEAMGTDNKFCSEGENYVSQCLTCSFFQEEDEAASEATKTYLHCGDIGNIIVLKNE